MDCAIFMLLWWEQIAHTFRWFTRAQSESRFFALCGSIISKKLGQAFQGLRVQGRARFALQTGQFPLETVRFPQGTVVASPQKAKSPIPKLAQQGVAKYPRVFCEQFPKGFAGRYSKGVPYGKRPFDAAFSHKRARAALSIYAVR